MMSDPADKEPDAHRLDAQLLSDLWIFRAAARFGSITEAARRLGVTQGAVSQRVLRLEARLGTLLFVRQKSRLTLTEAGSSLLLAMTQVALVLNESLSRINQVQRKAIVVSCVPSLATEWLVPNLETFYREHPGLEIFVRAEHLPVSAERMDENGIDVFISYEPEPLADVKELAAIQEYNFPICSRDYRAALEADDVFPITLLYDDVPWIGGKAEAEWSDFIHRRGELWPNRISGVRRFNLSQLAYHAAILDQGVALGRSILVNRLIANGQLVPATRAAPVPGASYRLLANRPGDSGSVIRQFANWWLGAMRETQARTLELLEPADPEPA